MLVVAGAVVELGIEQLTSSPKWQGRIIVWLILAQGGALLYAGFRSGKYWKELRSHHRASTHVSTIEGFLDTLAMGADAGGMPVEVRRKIYEACKEQFRFYHEVIGDNNRRTQIFFQEATDSETEMSRGVRSVF